MYVQSVAFQEKGSQVMGLEKTAAWEPLLVNLYRIWLDIFYILRELIKQTLKRIVFFLKDFHIGITSILQSFAFCSPHSDRHVQGGTQELVQELDVVTLTGNGDHEAI